MSKKLKAFQVIEVSNVLAELAKKELSLKLAIIIAEIIEALSTSTEVISKRRQGIIEKYGKKDDNGNLIQSNEGNVEIADTKAFMEEINEALNVEVDVDFKPIEKELIEKEEDIKITPQQYLTLKLVMKSEEKKDNVEKVEGEVVDKE